MFESNVFLFFLVNTWSNGVCNRSARVLRQEGATIRTLLDSQTKHMPAQSTILENVNLPDEDKVERILQLQLQWIKAQEPWKTQDLEDAQKTEETRKTSDPWERVVVDSTAVKANAAHPVVSALIVEQVRGALREYDRM